MSYDFESEKFGAFMQRHILLEPVSARLRNAMRRLSSILGRDGDIGPAVDAANRLARIEQEKLRKP